MQLYAILYVKQGGINMKPTPEQIVHEAARRAIIDLVGVLSTSISTKAKRTKLSRIADDLVQAVLETEP